MSNSELTLTVSSRLEVEGLPEDLAQRFRRETTFANPKFELLERLGKWLRQLYKEGHANWFPSRKGRVSA